MQIKPLLKKGLVVGIIVLLVMNLAPLVNSSSSGRVIAGGKLNPTSLSDSRGINITVTGTKGWNDWYVSNVIVTFISSNTTYYNINNGPWTELTSPPNIIFTIDGYYNVSAYCVYSNGTQSPIVTVSFKIDKTAPTIVNFTVNRVGFFKWKFTADVSDKTSGINCVAFYLDDQLIDNCTTYPYIAFWKHSLFLYQLKKLILHHTLEIVPNCIVYDNAGNSQCPQIPGP